MRGFMTVKTVKETSVRGGDIGNRWHDIRLGTSLGKRKAPVHSISDFPLISIGRRAAHAPRYTWGPKGDMPLSEYMALLVEVNLHFIKVS